MAASFRPWWFALPVVLLGFVPAAATAQEVRIVAVDGRLDASGQVREVQVQPGQVVSLTADEVWRDASGQPEFAYRDVADFLWDSSVSPGDRCDPSTDCRATSNFEVTEYGVNFYVPWDPPRRITINVTTRWGGGRDTIVLVDERALSARQDYRDLDGLGHWVSVAGDRVFVPRVVDPDWSPYVHGYWYWTAFGWTWYSYDPWGHLTDHFGHWRHSHLYGWVWIPDPLWVWRPAIVSFFYGPSWIGWYPYDPGWSWGYRHGYAHGYDDGYWAGYHAGYRDGHRRGHRHHRGHVMVGYNDFYVPGDRRGPPPRAGERPPARSGRAHNIADVRVRETDMVDREVSAALGRGDIGALPGGARDLAGSREFIAGRSGARVEEVRLDKVGLGGAGAGQFRYQPKQPPFEAPKSYAAMRESTLRDVRGVRSGGPKVGTALRRPQATAPVTGVAATRGVAPAPVRRDAASRTQAAWQPGLSRTRPAAGQATPAQGAPQVRSQPGVRPAEPGRPAQDVRRDDRGSSGSLYQFQGTPARPAAPEVETRAPAVRRPDAAGAPREVRNPGTVRDPDAFRRPAGGFDRDASGEDEDAIRRRQPARPAPADRDREDFRRDAPRNRAPVRRPDTSSYDAPAGVAPSFEHRASAAASRTRVTAPAREAARPSAAARPSRPAAPAPAAVRSSDRVRSAPSAPARGFESRAPARQSSGASSSGSSSGSSSSSSSYSSPSRSSAPARTGGGGFGRGGGGGRSAPAGGRHR